MLILTIVWAVATIAAARIAVTVSGNLSEEIKAVLKEFEKESKELERNVRSKFVGVRRRVKSLWGVRVGFILVITVFLNFSALLFTGILTSEIWRFLIVCAIILCGILYSVGVIMTFVRYIIMIPIDLLNLESEIDSIVMRYIDNEYIFWHDTAVEKYYKRKKSREKDSPLKPLIICEFLSNLTLRAMISIAVIVIVVNFTRFLILSSEYSSNLIDMYILPLLNVLKFSAWPESAGEVIAPVAIPF